LQEFVKHALAFVEQSRPEVEKVDFVIERNGQFSRYIQEHADAVREYLRQRFPRLEVLMGDVIPAGKDRAPLQAADCACWHLQKIDSNKFTRTEHKRYTRIAKRDWIVHETANTELDAVHDRVVALNHPNPFPAKSPFERGKAG
jgi:hypothetical protein